MSTQNLVGLISMAQCSLRSSSHDNNGNSVYNINLDYKNDPNTSRDGSEAWVSWKLDTNQYVRAGCKIPRTFVAVSVQGRGDADQWITSFKIRYTLDSVYWHDTNVSSYTGVKGLNDIVTHFFNPPFRARSIELTPLTWHNHISLRCEFYVERIFETFTQVGQINSPSVENRSINEQSVPVVFPVPFGSIPKVSLTFDSNDTLVGTVQPRDITLRGFTAVFKIQGSLNLSRLLADYVAVSQE